MSVSLAYYHQQATRDPLDYWSYLLVDINITCIEKQKHKCYTYGPEIKKTF